MRNGHDDGGLRRVITAEGDGHLVSRVAVKYDAKVCVRAAERVDDEATAPGLRLVVQPDGAWQLDRTDGGEIVAAGHLDEPARAERATRYFEVRYTWHGSRYCSTALLSREAAEAFVRQHRGLRADEFEVTEVTLQQTRRRVDLDAATGAPDPFSTAARYPVPEYDRDRAPVLLTRPDGTAGTIEAGAIRALVGYVEQRDAAGDQCDKSHCQPTGDNHTRCW